MRFRFFSLVISLAALLSAGAAFADTACPEGTVGFVNTETYEKVCLPINAIQGAQGAQAAPSAAQDAADVPAQDDAWGADSGAAENVDAATDVADAPAPAADGVNFVPRDPASPSVPAANQGVLPAVAMRNKAVSRADAIHDQLMQSGWSIDGGIGYGMVANIDLRLMAGYQHTFSKNMQFGIYLDANFKVGIIPDFTADILVVPSFIVTRGRFRFRLGIGLGVTVAREGDEDYIWEFLSSDAQRERYGNYDDDYYYYDDDDKMQTYTTFTFCPQLSFDWFLTGHAYYGFGLSIPLLIHSDFDDGIVPMMSADLHIGYKF